MTYHMWGDEWFEDYGDDLYRAQKYIYTWTKRLSGCTLISKEKYGTIRYEALFVPYTGYYLRKNWIDSFLRIFGRKTIIYTIDNATHTYAKQRFLWHESYLCRLWTIYGKFILRLVVKRACKKFPTVRDEILADFDWWK